MAARVNLELTHSTVTLTGVKEDSRVRHEFHLSAMREIRVTDIGRGAWRGAKRGLILGAPILAGCLAAAIHDSEKDAAPWWGVAYVGFGLVVGPLTGMAVLSTEHYQFNEQAASNQESPGQGSDLRFITLFLPKPEETSDAIGVKWNRRHYWLPKLKVTIERTADGCVVTIPVSLLEPVDGR